MTWPRPDVSLRSSDASAVTVTVSLRPPTVHLEIEADGFARRDADAVAGQRLKPVQLDADAIVAGGEALDRIAAVGRGDHRARLVGADRGRGDDAPGTACPVPSETTPVNAPAPTWAAAGAGHRHQEPQAQQIHSRTVRSLWALQARAHESYQTDQ